MCYLEANRAVMMHSSFHTRVAVLQENRVATTFIKIKNIYMYIISTNR
jgi:hypothetical protein